MACLRYLQRKVKQQRPPRAGPSPPFIRRVETALFFLFLGAQPLSHLSAHFLLSFLLAWGLGTGPAHCRGSLLPSTGAAGTLMYWGAGADWTSRVRLALSAWRGSSGFWLRPRRSLFPRGLHSFGRLPPALSARRLRIGPADRLLGARACWPRISPAIHPRIGADRRRGRGCRGCSGAAQFGGMRAPSLVTLRRRVLLRLPASAPLQNQLLRPAGGR